ncbi:MAG: NUDIX domain-containing protein [Gemmatimonadales bacterium]|nr:NUDIX domain-containing protein [Gemmatimonadales bacterium]
MTEPTPMEIRPAATVLLLRDTPAGVEVFMARRNVKSGFVGGAFVFPGGRVDAADDLDPARCVGLDEAGANARLGLDRGGLAHYVAAIRECFEEAGILLAYDRTGAMLDFEDQATEDRFKDLRDRLNAGTLSLAELVERENLRLATDQIGYWSHWITPPGESRRFDTRFFVAHAPERQTAGHDDWELTSSAWVLPSEAIERAHRREWLVIFPTLMNLRALARHPTADAAVRWAATQRLPLPANLPKIYQGRVVLPGDEGYDQGESDISKLDRETRDRAFLP